MDKYVIGIDQSYTRTGITVLKNKKIWEMLSIDYKECKNNSEKRCVLENSLNEIMCSLEMHCSNPLVITERIRLKSQGGRDRHTMLSENYIKSTGALVATIIDFFEYYNEIPVYSVDTRSWKSAIVGSSKPLENPYGIDENKYRTILYMRDKGLLRSIAEPYEGRGKKSIINVKMDVIKDGKKVRQFVPCKMNDDLADSYCIALYGFLPVDKQKLQLERF